MATSEGPITKRARFEPTPVLPDIYTRPLQMTRVYVAPVMDKKLTFSIVRTLSEKFPLKDLQHLKRVRSSLGALEVILCPEAANLDAIRELIKEGLDFENTREQQVSKYAPLTREQFEESLKLWPTQFHEDKLMRSILDSTIFSPAEWEQMQRCMQLVIDRAHDEQAAAKMSADSSRRVNVAAIVNPRNGVVLAVGTDRRHVHPALHAAMTAIDLVAVLQGGGAWHTTTDLDGDAAPSPGQHLSEADQLITAAPANGRGDGAASSTSPPYICTGYDVYLLHEPCSMCAMALAHSRIRRAFYECVDPQVGALGSRFSVHCLGGLNHSFHVWKNVLRQQYDCRSDGNETKNSPSK